jgi:hypothetical protein
MNLTPKQNRKLQARLKDMLQQQKDHKVTFTENTVLYLTGIKEKWKYLYSIRAVIAFLKKNPDVK